jgi:hypothetical protein
MPLICNFDLPGGFEFMLFSALVQFIKFSQHKKQALFYFNTKKDQLMAGLF